MRYPWQCGGAQFRWPRQPCGWLLPPFFAASGVVARVARFRAVIGSDDSRPLTLEALHPAALVGLAVVLLGEAPLRRRHPAAPASDEPPHLLVRLGQRWHGDATGRDGPVLGQPTIGWREEPVLVQLPGVLTQDGVTAEGHGGLAGGGEDGGWINTATGADF